MNISRHGARGHGGEARRTGYHSSDLAPMRDITATREAMKALKQGEDEARELAARGVRVLKKDGKWLVPIAQRPRDWRDR